MASKYVSSWGIGAGICDEAYLKSSTKTNRLLDSPSECDRLAVFAYPFLIQFRSSIVMRMRLTEIS